MAIERSKQGPRRRLVEARRLECGDQHTVSIGRDGYVWSSKELFSGLVRIECTKESTRFHVPQFGRLVEPS
jgi:hypothetical protein